MIDIRKNTRQMFKWDIRFEETITHSCLAQMQSRRWIGNIFLIGKGFENTGFSYNFFSHFKRIFFFFAWTRGQCHENQPLGVSIVCITWIVSILTKFYNYIIYVTYIHHETQFYMISNKR